jgi:hypothetical protein
MPTVGRPGRAVTCEQRYIHGAGEGAVQVLRVPAAVQGSLSVTSNPGSYRVPSLRWVLTDRRAFAISDSKCCRPTTRSEAHLSYRPELNPQKIIEHLLIRANCEVRHAVAVQIPKPCDCASKPADSRESQA